MDTCCFVLHYLYTFYSDLSNMFERNSLFQLFINYVFSIHSIQNNFKEIILSKKRIIRRINNQFINVGKLLLNWNLYVFCDWSIKGKEGKSNLRHSLSLSLSPYCVSLGVSVLLKPVCTIYSNKSILRIN